MRVLHVITELTGGGGERLLSQLVPKIRERGVACGVMSIYQSAVPDALANGVDLIQIGRKRGFFDAGFFSRMIGAMKAWKPDVVHTHLHTGDYWGRAAAIAAGVPTIVRTEHSPCQPAARVAGARIAQRVLNNATASIVTFTQEQGRYLARFEGLSMNKVAIIPNGIVHAPLPTPSSILEARDRLAAGPDIFAIVQLGNLHQVKNQRLSLQTLAAMDSRTRQNIRLFFIGEGADRAALTQLAHDLNIHEHVYFMGFRDDVARILPGANLVIMPSIKEGMPLALLEAMSAGVPVLTTPWIGARDLLHGGACGTVSDDWEPATLAQCVQTIVDHYDGARAMADYAKLTVRQEYDIALTALRHCELYERLRGQRAA